MKKIGILFLGLLALSGFAQPNSGPPQKPVIIGYVSGFRGILNTDIIKPAQLTHINYAFVDIKDGRAWLHNEVTDTVNFRKLNELKLNNPDLKILISIGGWDWSNNFSDAMLTDASRKAFAASAVDIIDEYKLDGVDIDWEYPNMPGDTGHVYRPVDKQNYTLMFEALREKLDSLEQADGSRLLLTTAVGGSASFIANTEMDKAATLLDYVNIMTYDFYGGEYARHHTNLYSSVDEPPHSSDLSVKNFIEAGVPPSKIVLGLAFYGRGYIVDSKRKKGLNQKIIRPERGGGYTRLKDSLINKNGYRMHWDRKAKAPFLFNKDKKHFITFDSERSVNLKCQYVKENRLAGVMFWEYYSDSKGYLLNEINECLR